MQKISVIIVNWNTGKLLAQCVASLCSVPEASLLAQVVVVDNASHDKSIVHARERYERLHSSVPVRFIFQKTNVGFAKASNIGIAAAAGGTDVLLLNPDTEVLPGALDAMLTALHADARTAVVGPQLLNPNRTVQPSVRSLPTLLALVWLFLKLHRLFPQVPWWRRYMQSGFTYGSAQAVEQVMGAAFLIRSDTLAKLGTLDDRFYLWFEEVDYCQRVHAAGLQTFYTPAAQIIHHGAISFNQLVGVRRAVPFLMSALRYARKHLGVVSWGILFLLFPFAVLLSIPASVLHIARKRSS